MILCGFLVIRGRRRVGVDEHFLILLSLLFENSERDRRTIKEHLTQQHPFLEHGIVDFMVCSVHGFVFNDLPAIFSFSSSRKGSKLLHRSYCTKTSNFKYIITEQATFLLGYISMNAERCLRSYSAFFCPPNSPHSSLLLSSLLQQGPFSCFAFFSLCLLFSILFFIVSSHKFFFKFFYLKDFINRYPKKYTKHEVFSVHFFQLCTEGKVKKKKVC